VRPFNHVQVEFMPVYEPNEAEKTDPELFAKNVQTSMAASLGIFPSNDTYYKYLENYDKEQNKEKED